MPIYEYRCQACGRQHEALQKVSDKPLKSCPSCGKRALKRLMSAPRFRLKGAGWYETDFKSDKETKRNLAESGGEAPPASTSDAGGDGGGSSGEKSGDGKVEKSGSGDKSDSSPGPRAEGKGSAGPSAHRKPSAVRIRTPTRSPAPARSTAPARKPAAARKPAGTRRRPRTGRA